MPKFQEALKEEMNEIKNTGWWSGSSGSDGRVPAYQE
jgi:hypothetical protein